MNLFLSLKLSIRCGDAIAIEDVYIKFLPIFSAARKTMYVEIMLHSIYQYYSVLSKQKLHLLQCNRTARLYDGESKFGSVFSEWSQDPVMELLQKYLHNMHFPATIHGYKKHSGGLMFYYRSLLFCNSKYYRLNSVEDIENKFGRKNDLIDSDRLKYTTVPKQLKEKQFMREMIELSECAKEVINRTNPKTSSGNMWNAIYQTTVAFRERTAAEEDKEEREENCNAEEKIYQY